MITNAKTIQIFLPNGDPRGLRVAEITTRIVRVVEVPRSLISDFLKMPEAKQVGLYFFLVMATIRKAHSYTLAKAATLAIGFSATTKTKTSGIARWLRYR